MTASAESSTETSSTLASTSSATSSATSEGLHLTTEAASATSSNPPTTAYTTVAATGSSGAPQAQPQSAAKAKSTTLTVLIIVGSSVAAAAILWTVFRKWKLSRSTKFDERLNPIDFQPTAHDDGAIPGAHRRHSGSSFHSGTGHGHGHGYTSNAINPIPDHDFTAGPATLAPVGGYADLTRGPSPQPQMHQVNYDIGNMKYDAGVPLHHQTPYVTHDAYDPSGRRY